MAEHNTNFGSREAGLIDRQMGAIQGVADCPNITINIIQQYADEVNPTVDYNVQLPPLADDEDYSLDNKDFESNDNDQDDKPLYYKESSTSSSQSSDGSALPRTSARRS
jgi:hypothetical protein